MGKSDTTDNGQAAELPPENIDAALVARIAAGDRQAETALVRRYSRAVRALLEQRVRSRETASDLVQETFIVVIARIRDSGIHDPSRIAGFLRQTAINLANSEKRKALGAERNRRSAQSTGFAAIHRFRGRRRTAATLRKCQARRVASGR